MRTTPDSEHLVDSYISDLIQKKVQQRNNLPKLEAATSPTEIAKITGGTNLQVAMSGLNAIGQGINGSAVRAQQDKQAQQVMIQKNFENQQSYDKDLIDARQQQSRGAAANTRNALLAQEYADGKEQARISKQTAQNTHKYELELTNRAEALGKKYTDTHNQLLNFAQSGQVVPAANGNFIASKTATDEAKQAILNIQSLQEAYAPLAEEANLFAKGTLADSNVNNDVNSGGFGNILSGVQNKYKTNLGYTEAEKAGNANIDAERNLVHQQNLESITGTDAGVKSRLNSYDIYSKDPTKLSRNVVSDVVKNSELIKPEHKASAQQEVARLEKPMSAKINAELKKVNDARVAAGEKPYPIDKDWTKFIFAEALNNGGISGETWWFNLGQAGVIDDDEMDSAIKTATDNYIQTRSIDADYKAEVTKFNKESAKINSVRGLKNLNLAI